MTERRILKKQEAKKEVVTSQRTEKKYPMGKELTEDKLDVHQILRVFFRKTWCIVSD